MIKKLTKAGNSLALVIDRPILELLNLDAQTSLEVKTDGRSITVSPADPGELQSGRRRKVEEAIARVNRRTAQALRRLAR